MANSQSFRPEFIERFQSLLYKNKFLKKFILPIFDYDGDFIGLWTPSNERLSRVTI